MASRASRREAAQAARVSELVQKYSGIGKTFRVKYVGSEDIKEKQNDNLTASVMRQLREKRAQTKGHKPKVVLGMNIKGITLLEESNQVRTTVIITNVCYIRLDVNDMKFFGMIIKTKESKTMYKLYVFKAEKSTATNFVTSAQELLFVVKKMLQEKKQERKQVRSPQSSITLEAEKDALLAAAIDNYGTQFDEEPAEVKSSSEPSSMTEPSRPTMNGAAFLPAESETTDSAEPDGESESSAHTKSSISVQERRQKAKSELLQLETELNELFQDIMSGKDSKGDFEDVLSKRSTWAPSV